MRTTSYGCKQGVSFWGSSLSGRYLSGESLSSGRRSLFRGGFCPGRSLSRGEVSVQGRSWSSGNLCPGGHSFQEGEGLCLGEVYVTETFKRLVLSSAFTLIHNIGLYSEGHCLIGTSYLPIIVSNVGWPVLYFPGLGDGWGPATLDTEIERDFIRQSQKELGDVQDYFIGGSAPDRALNVTFIYREYSPRPFRCSTQQTGI